MGHTTKPTEQQWDNYIWAETGWIKHEKPRQDEHLVGLQIDYHGNRNLFSSTEHSSPRAPLQIEPTDLPSNTGTILIPPSNTVSNPTDNPHYLEGFQIRFLPEVENLFPPQTSDPPNHTNTETHELDMFRDWISEYHSLPDIFWKSNYRDANGYYVGMNHHLTNSSHWSMCRYLIKNCYDDLSYKWSYLTICSLWLDKTADDAPTPIDSSIEHRFSHIYLCFGFSEDLQKDIITQCGKLGKGLLQGCPFAGYNMMLELVADRYDHSVSCLRAPIRGFEKNRTIPTTSDKDTGSKTPQSKTPQNTYVRMHEVARHVIHVLETLDVAIETTKSLLDDHQKTCSQPGRGSCFESFGNQKCFSSSISRSVPKRMILPLGFYLDTLVKRRCRAWAFHERLRNEIQLALSKDGRELTTVVSIATLVFLPASTISGFFGMNFFTLDRSGANFNTSPYLWVFFCCTIPLTLFSLGVWLANSNVKPRQRWVREVVRLLRWVSGGKGEEGEKKRFGGMCDEGVEVKVEEESKRKGMDFGGLIGGDGGGEGRRRVGKRSDEIV